MAGEPTPETWPGRAVLDTNVLIGGAFRPRSASGRLLAAVRTGAVVNVWTTATRAEAERLAARVPPLQELDLAPLFPEAGRAGAPPDPDTYVHVVGSMDQVFAALADAADLPLITSDRRLAEGARAHGVRVLTPSAALRALG